MFNNYELDEAIKDLVYLGRLDKHLQERGVTLATATQSDIYDFIRVSHAGEIDRRTGKPITSISYTGDLEKINDLVCKYKKMKKIIQLVLENEVL